MLMAEYDYDMDIAVQREEAAEKAAKEALERGIAQGRSEGLSEGLARGRSEGLAQGRSEGLSEGLVQGRSEGVVDGIRLMKKALELNEQGLSEAEIAKELEISIEQVRMMLE